MKNTLLLFLALCSSSLLAQVCNPGGNVLIYTNYDGGDITIDIDEDIPDIRIGICSYESISIEITGDFVDNVTQVLYAGYDDDGTTSISGVPSGITDILLYPPATLSDPDGYPYIICAYDCDTDYVPGGCNTVEQVTDYFLTELGGELRYSFMQYGVWAGGDYYMSEGGNCCYGADVACFTDIIAGKDQIICAGETTLMIASGADTYTWTPMDGLDCTGDCAEVNASPETTSTYVVFGTDADGCFGYDTITVYVNETPDAGITVSNDTAFASGGVSYQWLLDGVILPGETGTFVVAPETGNYSVIVYSSQGCADTSAMATVIVEQPQEIKLLTEQITIYPNPADDLLQISWPSALVVEDISLFNALGQMVRMEITTESTSVTCLISQLPPGIYQLQISTGSGILKQRVIIQ